jgi:hypothetical protein
MLDFSNKMNDVYAGHQRTRRERSLFSKYRRHSNTITIKPYLIRYQVTQPPESQANRGWVAIAF